MAAGHQDIINKVSPTLELSDAVPRDLFAPMFQEVREVVLATDWASLQATCPRDIPPICQFIWDEMVHRNVATEPWKIGPIVQNDFTGIADFIRQELGETPVSEAFAASYYNEIDQDNSFVDVSLVRCWPNDIHIADIEFSDNRKPIHAPNRSYHGLHVFGEFVSRLRSVAQQKKIERVSLMVAHRELYEVFFRHGFRLSETRTAQFVFANFGTGFPMILAVD